MKNDQIFNHAFREGFLEKISALGAGAPAQLTQFQGESPQAFQARQQRYQANRAQFQSGESHRKYQKGLGMAGGNVPTIQESQNMVQSAVQPTVQKTVETARGEVEKLKKENPGAAAIAEGNPGKVIGPQIQGILDQLKGLWGLAKDYAGQAGQWAQQNPWQAGGIGLAGLGGLYGLYRMMSGGGGPQYAYPPAQYGLPPQQQYQYTGGYNPHSLAPYRYG